MRAPGVERRHVREVGAEDGGAVQGREVVTLQVAVHDHLPVRPLEDPRGVVVAVGEAEGLEQLEQLGLDPRVEVELGARRERHEHDACALPHRQLPQTHVGPLDRAEGLLAVDTGQAARQVVGPRVVRAGEPSGVSRALGDEFSPTVPAGVHQRLDVPAALAGQDDGGTDDVQCLVRARRGQLARQRHRQRTGAVDRLDLAFPELGVGVVPHGLAPLRLHHVRRRGPVVLDQPRHDVERVLADRRAVEVDARGVLGN
jgi:hypothetical protein